MNNLILIGFMASGKSTIGRILADQLKMEFIDTDTMIEKKAGKEISSIFFNDGEEAFRTWERLIARYIMELHNKVVSTGGGMIIKNHDLLKQSGTLVYLKIDPQTVIERTRDNYRERPLLNYPTEKERLKVVTKLLNKREQFYQYYADLVIENNADNPYNAVMEIIERLGLKK